MGGLAQQLKSLGQHAHWILHCKIRQAVSYRNTLEFKKLLKKDMVYIIFIIELRIWFSNHLVKKMKH